MRPSPSPLPPNLQEAAASLREHNVSDDFGLKLTSALNEVDAQAKAAQAARSKPRIVWPVPTTILTLFIVGSASIWMAQNIPLPKADKLATINHQHELELEHPGEELIWMDVNLTMHPHNGEDTIIRVEAPAQVTIKHGHEEDAAPHTPECDEHKCVHHLPQKTATKAAKPLKVGIPHQGKWELNVSHRSQDAHIREAFTIKAR